MRRSTFVVAGIAAFAAILATFLLRGTTRLIIGDRASLWLALPLAGLSLVLVVTLVLVAVLDTLGIKRMEDDLGEG